MSIRFVTFYLFSLQKINRWKLLTCFYKGIALMSTRTRKIISEMAKWKYYLMCLRARIFPFRILLRSNVYRHFSIYYRYLIGALHQNSRPRFCVYLFFNCVKVSWKKSDKIFRHSYEILSAKFNFPSWPPS